ncbi:Pol [Symbiodinium sp. KB8]|nr:Pol [Symbiodinium sp. KB8]
MGIEEEMDRLRTFFSELYQADSHNPPPHFLQEAIPVESWEVTAALHSMPAHKALPPGQAPARLWKLAARSVETELWRDFNAALQPGELCFPHHWHESHLALLAKLQPLVQQALQWYPQFAYAQGRQTSDALDRDFKSPLISQKPMIGYRGCGLSPLLWLAFTLLLHDKMSEHIPLQSQTSYADDLHLMWEFSTAQEFKRACTALPKLLACLQSFGMEVSLEKTVALLAIKGPAAAALLKQYTKRAKGVAETSSRCPYAESMTT